jgi:3-isopropylmalate/(R)-2-methylmalate dehydratase small subunit
MPPFTRFSSRTVVLPATNIDTDQIIPARFLTTTTREGLGAHLFADWRYDERGAPRPDFALNHPASAGCRILVAGRNFGCGSSREHAPWALVGWGLRAIVALSFADIFRQNAMKNGLLPVQVPLGLHEVLVAERARDPSARIAIDLAAQTVGLAGSTAASARFDIDPFAKECLLHGVDELGYLLARLPDIERHESTHIS